jgi:hypothetical protein
MELLTRKSKAGLEGWDFLALLLNLQRRERRLKLN